MRVDQPTARTERGGRVLRALPLWSERYGLIGKADVVEVLATAEGEEGSPRLRPVEYKVGGPVQAQHAAYQAAAQAICLEEMLGAVIEEVGVYFIKTKERRIYPLEELRQPTLEIVERIRHMQVTASLPCPANDKRCPKCSLIDACQPKAVALAQSQREKDPFRPLPLKELP